ncbi:ABC transporter permease [Streptococcus pneumoniae]|nr:ABC transporter permease [Streptococcus pneumoniae]
MKKFSKTLRDNWIFLLMVLPGALWVDSILLHSSIWERGCLQRLPHDQ